MRKIHEEMITVNDALQTVDLGKYYAILPFSERSLINKFLSKNKGKLVNKNFSYNSRSNDKFLSIYELRRMLKKENLI